MKKIFTLITTALFSLSLMAEDYTCPLVIKMGGESMAVGDISVSVTKQDDGTYTMNLKNFMLGESPVGTINLAGVSAETVGNTTVLATQQTIQIEAGDTEGVEDWMGPFLGDVPINMKGELKGGVFNAILGINMGADLGVIGVNLGNGSSEMGQIPNSGFENFHTAKYSTKTSDEPNAWHSFMTAETITLTNSVKSAVHTFTSDDVRPGSTGTKSVKVVSTPVLSAFSANGTITTGRLQAKSTSATNTDNCSYLDLSKTDTDANGDPYYTILTNQPDSITVWMKYHVGSGTSSANANATISAIITDGTYYQDPENKTYTNIVAKAQNAKITSNSDAWQRISVPFDYDSYASNGVSPKAILVTMSTCATPSGGSKSSTDPDAIWVDDVELIYNCEMTALKVKGQEVALTAGTYAYEVDGLSGTISADDFDVTTNGRGAYVSKVLTDDAGAVIATITVQSNDLNSYNIYTVTIKGASTGINKVQNTQGNGTTAIYNVNGQRVQNMTQSGLYIIKSADGTTRKVIRK